jgi:hypothetical protein
MSHVDHLHHIDHAPEMADDLAAIAACLDEWGIALVDDWDERSLFNPTLPALGQCDALVTSSKLDGVLVLDLKTGSIKPLDCAMQLACYAGATHEARLVDGAVELVPLPFDIRTDVGLILHAPWGKGKASIVVVDLIEGRRLAELAIAAHQETLDSGRVVIKDVPAKASKERETPQLDEPAGDSRAIELVEGPSGVLVTGTPAPSLHARIGDLRRRAKLLVEQGVITTDDARDFMVKQDIPPLNQPDLQTGTDVDTWENWITTLEMALDAGARLPGIVERLEALPVDLYAHVERLSKEATPPVPNLTKPDDVTGPDLDRLEAIMAPVELLHAERVAQVTQALSGMYPAEADEIVEWACEQLDGELRRQLATLDNLEAERVLALCATYAVDDLPKALRDLGPAKDVIATARRLAERHQIAPLPKSGRDVAVDRVLAGLVLTQHTESN